MAEQLETLILGAGPAGLQLAHELERAGRSYLVVERGASAGAFFERFPRHRKLLSPSDRDARHGEGELDERWDFCSLLSDAADAPRFRDYSSRYFPDASELARYLRDFAARFALRIRSNTTIARVTRPGGFIAESTDGEVFASRRLVVATGTSEPYLPPIPGIELAERYADVSVDPWDFTDQRVLLLGKGSSAFEMAEALVDCAARIHLVAPGPVVTARTGRFGALVGRGLRKIAAGSDHGHALLDAHVERIRRDGDGFLVDLLGTLAGAPREQARYDRVIVCTGFRFDASIFDASCRPALSPDGRFPLHTSRWESENVPHMFFAGALMRSPGAPLRASGAIHGFRYDVRTLHRLLEERYHGVPLREERLPRRADALASHVLGRLHRTAALWHRQGFLVDAIALSGPIARYFEELPLPFVREGGIEGDDIVTVSLESGPCAGAPPDAACVAKGAFLHPVLRRHAGGARAGELHLRGNLFAEWRDPERHVAPLRAFFQRALSPSPDRADAKPATTPTEA